jgi:hypothetical protein
MDQHLNQLAFDSFPSLCFYPFGSQTHIPSGKQNVAAESANCSSQPDMSWISKPWK